MSNLLKQKLQDNIIRVNGEKTVTDYDLEAGQEERHWQFLLKQNLGGHQVLKFEFL